MFVKPPTLYPSIKERAKMNGRQIRGLGADYFTDVPVEKQNTN
jgi:hypothetical protein